MLAYWNRYAPRHHECFLEALNSTICIQGCVTTVLIIWKRPSDGTFLWVINPIPLEVQAENRKATSSSAHQIIAPISTILSGPSAAEDDGISSLSTSEKHPFQNSCECKKGSTNFLLQERRLEILYTHRFGNWPTINESNGYTPMLSKMFPSDDTLVNQSEENFPESIGCHYLLTKRLMCVKPCFSILLGTQATK